jgi:hypothetical protein
MSKKRKNKKGIKDRAIARGIYCGEEKEMSVEHHPPLAAARERQHDVSIQT